MRWKLTTEHYINDMILQPGTEIGDGTGIEFKGRPSLHMEPADKEAEEWLKANPNWFVKSGRPIPMEIIKAPNSLLSGQRPGGLGPKAESAVQVPGQGPRPANLEQTLAEKVLAR
jgi:hypothetical protein